MAKETIEDLTTDEFNQVVDNLIAREDDRTEPSTFLKAMREAAQMTTTTIEEINEPILHRVSQRTEAQQRFDREELSYWQQRDELLKQYAGKWVAIVSGQVAAVGEQMNKVAAEAWRKTGSGLMYVNLVGGEDVALRVRKISSGHYDRAYAPPMPMLTASVNDLRQTASADVTFVVDTGADLTLLQADVADQLGLWEDIAGRRPISGIGSEPEMRQLYNALVQVADETILVTVDCRDDISEDILGRDVINEFSLTVCAKRDQVEFEWVEDAEA